MDILMLAGTTLPFTRRPTIALFRSVAFVHHLGGKVKGKLKSKSHNNDGLEQLHDLYPV